MNQRQAKTDLNNFLRIVCDPSNEIDRLMIATLARKIYNSRRSAGDEQTSLATIHKHIIAAIPLTAQGKLL